MKGLPEAPPGFSIPGALKGKRVLITGSTGFLATALVERMLRCCPDVHLGLLVRPGRRGATHRVQREVLRHDCFDRLRKELGKDAFSSMCAERITAVGGDVSVDGLGLDDAGRAYLASCDTVIHSAATVSFDSALDTAVEINLLGPTRLVKAIQDSGSKAHMIAVSTAYVVGYRRGPSFESPLFTVPYGPDADWKAEVAFARRLRSDTEARSRAPELLARFEADARRELGAAGVPLIAEKTEKRRHEWVHEQLVDAGVARAHSLGWPDAYPYTKGLGEKALLESRGEVPVSIVRPSIIESSLAEPRPGWIRGFRMAEPIIINYARGNLDQFPGLPEGILDVIPVDLVVAAIIAVAAKGPDKEGPEVFHVASGSANPLIFRNFVEMVQEWFSDHPVHDSDGQPIKLADWSFPGKRKVRQRLARADKLMTTAERLVSKLPLRGKKLDFTDDLDEKRQDLDRVKTLVKLYASYTETEATYQVDRLLSLFHSLSEEDRATFNFDPSSFEWRHYSHDIHLPSIVQHARLKMTPGKKTGPSRDERGRKQVLAPERQLAAFDLENTVISSNVVTSYAWLATRRLPARDRVTFSAKLIRDIPSLLAQDNQDRGDFLRYFYRRYKNAPVELLDEDAWSHFREHVLTNAYPEAIRRIRAHKRLGHTTMLISGALDFVVEPLKPLFDVVVAPRMTIDQHGRYTGEMKEVPVVGEARALAIREVAFEHGYDLSECVAYADSSSDLPMLEVVGFPVAVNADAKLTAIARKRGWHTETFERSPGSSHSLLPVGRILKENRGWRK